VEVVEMLDGGLVRGKMFDGESDMRLVGLGTVKMFGRRGSDGKYFGHLDYESVAV
jgi:hypothetical protein